MKKISASSLAASERGLTLVEIAIVLVILAVAFAFLTKGLFTKGVEAKARINKMHLDGLKEKINQFQLMYNSLPQDLNSLTQCNEQTGSGCIPIAQTDDLVDTFGSPVQYASDGNNRYSLKSLGADKRDGGSGADGDLVVQGP